MGFIKFIEKSSNFEKLIKQRPTAFVLLALIVQRAKRSPDNFTELAVGEAYVGDYKTYGSSERQYRTDKNYLEKYKFSTFRSTNKGTIARIVDTSIFDISYELTTNKTTDKRRASDEQATTNIDIRNKNKDINTGGVEFQQWLQEFNQMSGKSYQVTQARIDKFAKRREKYSLADITRAGTALLKSPYHTGKNENNTWYADPDFLLRNDEQIDKWLNKATQTFKPVSSSLAQKAKALGYGSQ